MGWVHRMDCPHGCECYSKEITTTLIDCQDLLINIRLKFYDVFRKLDVTLTSSLPPMVKAINVQGTVYFRSAFTREKFELNVQGCTLGVTKTINTPLFEKGGAHMVISTKASAQYDTNHSSMKNEEKVAVDAIKLVNSLKESIKNLDQENLQEVQCCMLDVESAILARKNQLADGTSSCPVCLSAPKNMRLNCGHLCCESCTKTLRAGQNATCPICRVPIREALVCYI
jgi:hypothetical protein